MKRLSTRFLQVCIGLSLASLLSSCTTITVLALNMLPLTQTSVEDNRLYLLGDFNSRSDTRVLQALDDNPQVNTIVLTASSGSLDDETTLALAREIRRRKLNTHLLGDSVIASGAVDLFLSGVNRTMEHGAKLGVHSWTDGSVEAKDLPRDHEDHRLNANYINDMLGSEDFYWFTIYAAPADGLYWMSETEIEKFALVTTDFLEPDDKPTPFGDAFTEMQDGLLEEQ